MRLRELIYPIVVKKPNMVIGGRYAGLHKPSRFNWNIASYYQNGGYNDAEIIDCQGRCFEIEAIELHRPDWWYGIGNRIGNFRIFPDPDAEPMAKIDMVLRETHKLTLKEFCADIIRYLLENPKLWERSSSEARVRKIFEGDISFEDAINHIGVYDLSGREQLPGYSGQIVDLR